MKPFGCIAGKPAATIAVALLAAAALAACGGNSSTKGWEADTPKPAVDAFFTAVLALVASSPDNTEPGAIDAEVATAPEHSEAQPLS